MALFAGAKGENGLDVAHIQPAEIPSQIEERTPDHPPLDRNVELHQRTCRHQQSKVSSFGNFGVNRLNHLLPVVFFRKRQRRRSG
jgi:hypothetical protein